MAYFNKVGFYNLKNMYYLCLWKLPYITRSFRVLRSWSLRSIAPYLKFVLTKVDDFSWNFSRKNFRRKIFFCEEKGVKNSWKTCKKLVQNVLLFEKLDMLWKKMSKIWHFEKYYLALKTAIKLGKIGILRLKFSSIYILH